MMNRWRIQFWVSSKWVKNKPIMSSALAGSSFPITENSHSCLSELPNYSRVEMGSWIYIAAFFSPLRSSLGSVAVRSWSFILTYLLSRWSPLLSQTLFVSKFHCIGDLESHGWYSESLVCTHSKCELLSLVRMTCWACSVILFFTPYSSHPAGDCGGHHSDEENASKMLNVSFILMP